MRGMSAAPATCDIAVGDFPSGLRREQAPLSGDALENVFAPVSKVQPGAGDEILDGSGHENLIGSGERCDPRADVDGDAAEIVADHFAFAGVKSGADLDAQRPGVGGNGDGATDAARRPVERGQKPVAGRLDFAAPETVEITPNRPVVRGQEVAPAPIAERDGLSGRSPQCR